MQPWEIPLINNCTNCTNCTGYSRALQDVFTKRLLCINNGARAGPVPHSGLTLSDLAHGACCPQQVFSAPRRTQEPLMTVLVQTRHRVTLVTLHRPDRRNAVDAATAQALHAAFLAFEQDDAADVAVLHGAGGHFCAGWDLQSGARLQAQGVTPEALADTLDFKADSANPPGPMGPSRLQLS